MLSKKTASRNEFDKTISETEAAYMKVCDTCYVIRGTLKMLCNFIVIKYRIL